MDVKWTCNQHRQLNLGEFHPDNFTDKEPNSKQLLQYLEMLKVHCKRWSPAHRKLWAVRPFSTARQVRMLRKLVVTDCRLALWASLCRRSLAGLLLITTGLFSPCGRWAVTAACKASTQSWALDSLSARKRSTSSGKTAWKRELVSPSSSSRCTARQEASRYLNTGSETGPLPSVGKACSSVRLSTNVKALQLLRLVSWCRRPALRTSAQCWVNSGRAVGRTSGRGDGNIAASGSGSWGVGELARAGSPLRWAGRAAKTRSQRSLRHSSASHWQGARNCTRVLLKKTAWSTRPSCGCGAITPWQWDSERAAHSCWLPLLSRLYRRSSQGVSSTWQVVQRPHGPSLCSSVPCFTKLGLLSLWARKNVRKSTFNGKYKLQTIMSEKKKGIK